MAWLLKKFIIIGFWISVTFSLVISVTVVGVGQLLPYLDHYRPQIEGNLEQILGYKVTLGSIDGKLEGIDPTVSVSGFALNTASDTAITISELRVRLDLVKSILNFAPQFTYVRFVKPSVSLQEVQGQWVLSGARPTRSVKNDVGIERILDYLSEQQNFSIYDADIRIQSDQYGDHLFKIEQVYIYQQAFQSLLNSTVYLDGSSEPFIINARVDKSRSVFGNYRVRATIDAPNIVLPLDSWLAGSDQPLDSLGLSGSLWLEAVIGQELELRSNAIKVQAQFKDGQAYDATTALKLKYQQKRPGLRMDLVDLMIKDQQGKEFPTTDLLFDWSLATGRTNIAFNQVDLSLAQGLALQFLPQNSDANRLLTGLAPTGLSKNGSVLVWKDNEEVAFKLVSNLQQASVKAFNGIPKVNNVNALLSVSESKGDIDFRARNSELLFDTVYDEAWHPDGLSGYVGWQKVQDAFVVIGRDLVVQNNDSDISGGFRLEVRDGQPDWLGLDLKGHGISLQDRLTYVPVNALGDDLADWIKKAFSDSGLADNVDFMFHSDLEEGANPHVRLQLDVKEASVAFDENWPTAHKVNGRVELNKEGVFIGITSAYLEDVLIDELALSIPIINGVANTINIKGHIFEQAGLIMPLLKQTPLNDSVLKPFKSWVLEGPIDGRFDVILPFSGDTFPAIDLALRFEDNTLSMDDIKLAVDVSKGRLHFQTDKGIFDSHFTAQTLGGISHLTLSSLLNESNELAVIGALTGHVDISKVAEWRELPTQFSDSVSGLTSYAGEFAVNRSQNGQFDLSLNTRLVGVDIDLPAPIGKEMSESKLLQLKVRSHANDVVFDVDYGDFFRSRFLAQESAFVGGEVVFQGRRTEKVTGQFSKGLSILGTLGTINVEEWQPILMGFSSNTKASSPDFKIPEWLRRVDLIVDDVVINEDNIWHNFKVSYDFSKNTALFVNSDEVNFSLENNTDIPELHFGFLSWNTSSRSDSEPSKLSPISATQIPNMVLSVDQLFIDDNPYGDWRLRIAQNGNSVRIDPITSKLDRGEFKGALFWLDDNERSRVEFQISSSGVDLAELTKKYSADAFVSSNKYKIDVDLNWLGHPFYFDRESVGGRIAFKAEKGNFNRVDELPVFLKALGIFNIAALSRRLSLDFSDIYKPGLTYDTFSGTLSLDKGILKTVSPVTIISPTAELVLAGEADIVNETLNERLTATFPISGTLPIAGLLWGSPQLAGLLFITDKLIGDQLSKVTSVQYKIEGSFDNPTMTPIRFQPLGRKP